MVEYGSGILVGNQPEKILSQVQKVIVGQFRDAWLPDLWDGKSANRIVETLETALCSGV